MQVVADVSPAKVGGTSSWRFASAGELVTHETAASPSTRLTAPTARPRRGAHAQRATLMDLPNDSTVGLPIVRLPARLRRARALVPLRGRSWPPVRGMAHSTIALTSAPLPALVLAGPMAH